MAAKAAGDSAHGIEDGAAVDDDERAGGANVPRVEPGRSNEPIKRGVIIAPKPVAPPGQVGE